MSKYYITLSETQLIHFLGSNFIYPLLETSKGSFVNSNLIILSKDKLLINQTDSSSIVIEVMIRDQVSKYNDEIYYYDKTIPTAQISTIYIKKHNDYVLLLNFKFRNFNIADYTIVVDDLIDNLDVDLKIISHNSFDFRVLNKIYSIIYFICFQDYIKYDELTDYSSIVLNSLFNDDIPYTRKNSVKYESLIISINDYFLNKTNSFNCLVDDDITRLNIDIYVKLLRSLIYDFGYLSGRHQTTNINKLLKEYIVELLNDDNIVFLKDFDKQINSLSFSKKDYLNNKSNPFILKFLLLIQEIIEEDSFEIMISLKEYYQLDDFMVLLLIIAQSALYGFSNKPYVLKNDKALMLAINDNYLNNYFNANIKLNTSSKSGFTYSNKGFITSEDSAYYIAKYKELKTLLTKLPNKDASNIMVNTINKFINKAIFIDSKFIKKIIKIEFIRKISLNLYQKHDNLFESENQLTSKLMSRLTNDEMVLMDSDNYYKSYIKLIELLEKKLDKKEYELLLSEFYNLYILDTVTKKENNFASIIIRNVKFKKKYISEVFSLDYLLFDEIKNLKIMIEVLKGEIDNNE